MHMQEVIKPWYQIKNKKFKFLEKNFHFFLVISFGSNIRPAVCPALLSP